MSGQCVMKLPHKTEGCDSSDGLQVFLGEKGEYTGYCFACSSYVADPLKDADEKSISKSSKGRTEEEVKQEMEDISKLGAFDLPERKLRKTALDYYDIKVGVSEEDGKTPKYVHFPRTRDSQLVSYKSRRLDIKTMWSLGDNKNLDLFGWKQAVESGVKKLIICEGEFDAAALKRILEIYSKEQYKDAQPAVVSVNNGISGAVKDISANIDKIRAHFKEVAVCFDQDGPGIQGQEEVCKKFPSFKAIQLPCKDANEGLIKGIGKAVYNAAIFRTEKPKNTRLIWAETLHESAKKPAVRGYSWPWPHIDEATKGIRLGETIYIGAGHKQGKSELVNHLAAHFIKEHGWKTLLAKPEEANNKTYKMVAGKLMAKKFHDPDVPFDEEAYDRAGEIMKGKLAMINLYQNVDWDILKQDIYAAAEAGVKAVFLDPITNLVNGKPISDQNTELQRIAQEIAGISLDLDIVSFIFCHLRNPENGLPHERGGHVESSQFAGSRAMARSCNLMLGLEGNRDPSLDKNERNMRTLVLLEDREFGNTGRYGLFWDDKTTLFNMAA